MMISAERERARECLNPKKRWKHKLKLGRVQAGNLKYFLML